MSFAIFDFLQSAPRAAPNVIPSIGITLATTRGADWRSILRD
ncbi:MAG TPA: hypothetical protein VJ810_31840 [Blastocatellia bacterium]|nr:hypothetical protein [Blastocatellia bacterium]